MFLFNILDKYYWYIYNFSGKSKLKFEMRSYQEMVESKIKHINDDSQQLGYFKDKIAKEQIKSRVLADSLCKVSEKLRLTTEVNRVVRERTKEQHQQNKEEVLLMRPKLDYYYSCSAHWFV